MKFWVIIVVAGLLGVLSVATLSATGLPYSPLSSYLLSNGACDNSIPGDSGGPLVNTVDYSIHSDNSLIFNFTVDVDRPAQVWVEYELAGGNGEYFKTPLTQAGLHHELPVVRLRANTLYCFDVFAQDNNQISGSVPGSFLTGPLPPNIASATINLTQGQLTPPVTMIEHSTDQFDGILAIDSEANIVWYYEEWGGRRSSPIVQDLSTLNLLYRAGSNIREITPLGDPVGDQSPNVCTLPTEDPTSLPIRGGPHHEILAPQGDEILYIGRIIKDPFNDSDRLQQGDTVRQWNRVTGVDTELWDPFPFLDAFNDRTDSSNTAGGNFWDGCDPANPVASEDWTHANSLQVVPGGNNIIMSLRHLNQIISIAPDFQSLQWRLGDANQLGNPTSDFEFPEPADRFYHQHSARQLPNGNILLFDNGNGRPLGEGGAYSRGLELELDFDTMEARKVWEYQHSPSLYAGCCSNVTRLNNGNSIVMFGAEFGVGECCRTFTLVEADNQGNAVGVVQISDPGKSVQYRAYPIESIYGESTAGGREISFPTCQVSDCNENEKPRYPSVGGLTTFLTGGSSSSFVATFVLLSSTVAVLALFALNRWFPLRRR